MLETARAMRASNEYTNIDTLDELKAHIEAEQKLAEITWLGISWLGWNRGK